MTDAQQQLAEAFRSLQVATRRMRGRQTRHHSGISYAQFGLLFVLEEGCPQSARSLGEAAELSPASVAQMLDGLEAGGLVRRTRSEQDKRVVLTELTDEGRAAIAEMRARVEPKWRAALAEFSDEDLATATAVLGRLAGYFNRMAEDPQKPPDESSDAVGAGSNGVA
jgi:DNA-binding MarR family transcriptional regulator